MTDQPRTAGNAIPGIKGFVTRPLAIRFWEKVGPAVGETECWEWTGARNSDGYGKVYFDASYRMAQRVAWELSNGPIPDGMLVCHSCDNPPCCRPDHLFLGTVADNNADMAAKGRARTPTSEIARLGGLTSGRNRRERSRGA